MNDPMISVVMPVYNGEKWLSEAVESILNQTYNDYEFIIINDGSNDRTEEIILSYNDDRIVYLKNEENLQIAKSLNQGIKLARGQYIARMDADDISVPKRFERQLDFMEKNPEVGVCGTWLQAFGETNEVWRMPVRHDEILVTMLFDSCIMHPTAFIRSDLLKKHNIAYNDQYNKAEDYELWSRLIQYTRVANVPEVLLKYRVYDVAGRRRQYKDAQRELANLVRESCLRRYGINPTPEELEIHLKISNCEYQCTVGFARESGKWFKKLAAFIEQGNIPVENKTVAKRVIENRNVLVLETLMHQSSSYRVFMELLKVADGGFHMKLRSVLALVKKYLRRTIRDKRHYQY